MAQTDLEALMVLYNATGGTNWTENRYWNTSVHLSRWRGVNVNDEGRVVQLGLSGNNLQGT